MCERRQLLLVRAEGRQRELTIRAALGAGWARIARGLLVESLTLGLAGGVVGLGLAAAALRALTTLAPTNLPRLTEISIDPLVLVFALAASLLCGLLFGIIPVLQHAGSRIATFQGAGRSGSQSREQHRSQSTLVVIQVALALVLLVGSGLMIRSFQAMLRVEPGFARPGQVQTVRLAIPETEVAEPARLLQMQHEMVDALATIPGVSSVSFMTALPMETEPSSRAVPPSLSKARCTSPAPCRFGA